MSLKSNEEYTQFINSYKNVHTIEIEYSILISSILTSFRRNKRIDMHVRSLRNDTDSCY